jgi:hypothetical protein
MPYDSLNGDYLGASKAEWELALEIEQGRVNFCHRCGSPHVRPYNGGRRWGYRLKWWRCQVCKATKPARIDAERLDSVYLLEDAPLHTDATAGKIADWLSEGKLATFTVVKSATAKWVMTSLAAIKQADGSYNGPMPMFMQLYQWAKSAGVSRGYMSRRLSEFGVYPAYFKHVTVYSDWQLDGIPLGKNPRPRITPGLQFISVTGDGYTVDSVFDERGEQTVYSTWQVARDAARYAHVIHAPIIPSGAYVQANGCSGITSKPLLHRSFGTYVKANGENQFYLREELIYNGESMAVRRGRPRKSKQADDRE